MGRAREQIKAMFDAVEQGDEYTISKGGTKVAVVIPYDRYLQLKARLVIAAAQQRRESWTILDEVVRRCP